MYVESDIPHIYFLSKISIVLRPTMTVKTLKLDCVLVWRDFPLLLIIYISPAVSRVVRSVEYAFKFIYLPKSNEGYINGSSSHGAIVRMHRILCRWLHS